MRPKCLPTVSAADSWREIPFALPPRFWRDELFSPAFVNTWRLPGTTVCREWDRVWISRRFIRKCGTSPPAVTTTLG